MPKPIKLTQDWIQKMLQEFAQTLGGLKLSDGKVQYSKSLDYEQDDEEGATILFEPVAYAKMLMLIHEFSDEVAWHGTVERLDKKTFVIKDIFVYPQEVTGGTVTTDQERYQTWLMELDDEVFNNLHMQGHSHVNMQTNPSPVDNKFYDSILEQLGDDDYYIFMVFNKRLERTVKIYDMGNNIFYDNKDVDIGIMCDGGDLEQFIVDAKDDVVEKTTYATTGRHKAFSTPTTYSKDEKKNEGVNRANNQGNLSQYPGYYGGYGGIGATGGDVDYDEEIFGKRADWWNR